ncbi:MAG: two-component sensor histidine kinase [Planctomycetes bacterium]|nr:two-component sensor histidine kinase [Planctomycetota bacterium]
MNTDSPSKPIPVSRSERDPKGGFHAHYRRLWLYSVCVTAFVSLTPLVIFTWVNFYQYRKALREEVIHPISRLASISRRFMDDFLEERRAALTYVARRESYEDLCDREKLSRTLMDMKESFGGFVDLGVIDSDGNQRSYAGPYELEGLNYKEQDWFEEVCVRGIHVSDVFRGYRNLPHFVVAVRQHDIENGNFYIVRATIDAEVLNSYISSLDLKPSSDVFLINRKGVLQTASRHNGAVLDQCPMAVPPFSSRTEVLETAGEKGEPGILAYAYIEHSPFIFVVLKHPEHVMESWLLVRSNILWFLGTSIVLIVVVILWSSTALVNRIRDADHRHDNTLHAIAYTNKMASIGRMAAGVAHEINNPLAIINENAGLLKDLVSIDDKPLERDRLLRMAEKVIRSVVRCSSITHRLLGFAKRMDPAIERFALGPLLEEILSFFGKETEYRRIAVNFDVPEDLPMVESDLGQLQQVFLNILSNAFAAVAEGGQVDISVEAVDENMVTVRIHDNGVGIPEEHIDHIFEPFFSTKGEYGTGLGLSITYGIVENLEGRIAVQSTVGEGTTFTVLLPIAMRR